MTITLLLAVFPSPTENTESRDYTSQSPLAAADSFITIFSEPSLAAFCTLGSGIEGDPYIIEDFVINASYAGGIAILNTYSYIEIRNCTVTGNQTYSGIVIQDCSNVKISRNILSNNTNGIWVMNCENIIIADNACSNNFNTGITIYTTDIVEISRNTVTGNHYGVYMDNVDEAIISDNILSGINFGGTSAIYMIGSDSNDITGNSGSHYDQGVYLDLLSDNNNLTGNTFTDNYYGIRARNSYSNRIIE